MQGPSRTASDPTYHAYKQTDQAELKADTVDVRLDRKAATEPSTHVLHLISIFGKP